MAEEQHTTSRKTTHPPVSRPNYHLDRRWTSYFTPHPWTCPLLSQPRGVGDPDDARVVSRGNNGRRPPKRQPAPLRDRFFEYRAVWSYCVRDLPYLPARQEREFIVTNTSEVAHYITGGTSIPSTPSARINSRRTTAAVASSNFFRSSSSSIRIGYR